MKKWIGSDFHFGHANIQKYCPLTRGHYQGVSDMDQSMIRDWNALVSPEDEVYMLGDVAFSNAEKAVAILKQLNGRKILVEGNHDKKNLRDRDFRACFERIHSYLDMNHNGVKIIMCHYPFAEWDQMHRGSVHFYGHLHQNTVDNNRYRARNVGMDCTGQILILLEDAIADALKGEIKQHHGD